MYGIPYKLFLDGGVIIVDFCGKDSEVILAAKFSDLLFWQKAHRFTLLVYQFTKSFPREERYGLTSQFRRAAVSVTANIAEGYTRKGVKDKLRFFNIALGSLEECRYYLILSKDLGYGEAQSMNDLLDEAARLLNAYSRTLKHKAPNNSSF